MRSNRVLCVLLLVVAIAPPAAALDVALESSRSRFAVGEQFTLSVQVSHAATVTALDDANGFWGELASQTRLAD